jgi:hypothetical protein
MDSFKLVLRREEGRGRMMVGMNLTKVHCKHIWKCHHETPPVQLIYANKMFKNMANV